MMPSQKSLSSVDARAVKAAITVCYFLLATSILPQPAWASVEATTAAPATTCSSSLNIGLDYFLRTQLFSNLTNVELPAEIALPISAFKIVNLKLAGLDQVSRGCSLQLSQVSESQLRLRACAHADRVWASFMIRAGNLPVDFVMASIKDTAVSGQAVANMVPGGLVNLEQFDITLGQVDVENTGITGSIITRVMRMNSVRQRLRRVIVEEATKKIREVLRQNPLPK